MKAINSSSLLVFVMLVIGSSSSIYAQSGFENQKDALVKDSIYKKNKMKVLNYSLKDFDALFFEFFDKKASSTVLSKEEFYSYTIRIGIFSERLAALYPDQKAIATENKIKWFAESYEDYVNTKKSQIK
ncbi:MULTISPECIES: hypothetical protein [unclassified Flavobacterium]|uniref:hypothetical protein n=1 Tax=unclassified Flavobacterium TaxID=196869 RepID=UPI00131C7AEB|nr:MULTISPECIES: hypothetical protein [unclassified Flavobacterium]